MATALLEKPAPTVMSDTICPSCGMVITAGPHRGAAQCIRALEEEIQRLEALLAVVRQSTPVPAKPEQT